MTSASDQRRALVTGGAGLIGSHLVDRLAQDGWQVTVIDDLSRGKKGNVNPKATFHECGLNDPELSSIVQDASPEAVFHLAAQIDVRVSVADALADAETNVVGSLNLLRACHEAGVRRFIFSSTGGAMYGDPEDLPASEELTPAPDSPYAIAKLAVEHYLHFYENVYGIKSASLRYGNVYGPRQDPYGEAGVIAIFIKAMLDGSHPVIYGDGEQLRDYVYVDDVIDANMAALERDVPHPINIGAGIGTSVNELYERLAAILKFGTPAQHADARAGEIRRCYLNWGAARCYLGWGPKISLDQGLVRTVDYFRAPTA